MKSVYRIVGMSLLAIIILSIGCVKRDNPVVPETPPAGQVAWFTHQYDGLTGTSTNPVWNQYPARRVAVYTPPGYDFTSLIGPRYPTLYLLPGFDGEPSFNFEYGNETYYMAASVAKVADRLIASGEIKPMFIVMPDASIPYGGSFYANSSLAGKWEDMMSVELVHKVDTVSLDIRQGTRLRTLAAKESRAIGGHSSGGYGAIRVAITNDSLFNSVSAIDAPLAFDGSGSFGGIKELFHAYLDESGIATEEQYQATDTALFRAQPYKVLFYSMAATFSPVPKTGSKFGDLQISLPFDYLGNKVDSVWNRWLTNDLFDWLNNATYQNILKNQNLYFESSDHDVNLFNEQTQLFEQKLTTLGVDYESSVFSKYEGSEARSRTFLYDRLEYILKFHNKYLRDRNGNY